MPHGRHSTSSAGARSFQWPPVQGRPNNQGITGAAISCERLVSTSRLEAAGLGYQGCVASDY
jgi:hypothetical protein